MLHESLIKYFEEAVFVRTDGIKNQNFQKKESWKSKENPKSHNCPIFPQTPSFLQQFPIEKAISRKQIRFLVFKMNHSK